MNNPNMYHQPALEHADHATIVADQQQNRQDGQSFLESMGEVAEEVVEGMKRIVRGKKHGVGNISADVFNAMPEYVEDSAICCNVF